ncbi:transcriptional repressor LexA [Derxia lacustris]|uniref:transcriptional repressor LexA n=1 Tax=Derxia lacustris TaxID=764842 RepID=UPI000A175716|nr:transcriptional repressor LexA [Derxia lacustris]
MTRTQLTAPASGARLTDRQREVLELIARSLRESGFPPTRAEIAASLGFRSVNAAEDHLQALAKKGVIELTPGASRGIRMCAPVDPTAAGADEGQSRGLSLPLVGRVAAGSPILAAEHIQASYACDPSMFSARPDYLLKVRGLSMRDAGILDGDLLAVQRKSEARTGQIVVARLGDEVTVKRYRKRGGMIELLPENPDFTPIEVRADDESFAIEGLAVGLIRVGVR